MEIGRHGGGHSYGERYLFCQDHQSSYPENLTDINGTLFFTAQDDANGRELWKSDGTEANGTVMVKDIYLGSGSSSSCISHLSNGTLFFTAEDPEGQELWKIDP